MRATGNGPRKFESQSNYIDDAPSPYCHTKPTARLLTSTDLMFIRLSVRQSESSIDRDTTATSSYLPWTWLFLIASVASSYDQPTPFNIDYSPECALVLKQSKGGPPFKRSLDAGLSYLSEYIPKYVRI
ncbi:chorion peroxidase [Trichonephila clavipes]|nr:chorion peroxidase [Trichonephila clavipes]